MTGGVASGEWRMANGGSWWSSWTGLRFADRGRSVQGVDCWGLVVLIYASHVGVSLPDRPEVSSLDSQAVNTAARHGLAHGPWEEVQPGTEQGFDLAIVWRPYRDAMGGVRVGPIHCGIVTRRGFLIHADEDAGVTAVPYAPEPHWSLNSRRLQCYRWRGEP